MIKMKSLITALIAIYLLAAPVLAITTVDTTWNGGGSFVTHFVSGNDAHSDLSTSGALISGEFHAIDYDNNPYGYNVDTTDTSTKAHVTNGNIIYTFTRDDSYVPMYGVAGQESYTYIGSSGTGDFAWHSNSNYAALGNSNYGWQSNNQMMATGNHYIDHYISANANNGAEIQVEAVGTTQISDMCDEASGATSFKFGKGCGCYTNDNVNTVGSGSFNLDAYADNQIVTDTGITVNGGSLNIHSDFDNGFHFNHFALTGN
jgi:hypothetical protein